METSQTFMSLQGAKEGFVEVKQTIQNQIKQRELRRKKANKYNRYYQKIRRINDPEFRAARNECVKKWRNRKK